MNERQETNRHWRWVVIATLALTLSSGQTALAEVVTPASSAGAAGGGTAAIAAGASSTGQAPPAHHRDATHVPESLQGARNAASQAVDVARYEGSQNARSIQMIESKEAPIELAGPAVGPAPSPF